MLRQFESLLAASDHAGFAAGLQRAIHALGFESYYYGAQAPVAARGAGPTAGTQDDQFNATDLASPLILTDWLPQWGQRYSQANYAAIDPVLGACSRSIVPLVWHRQPAPPERATALFMDDARQHGLGTGMTCSIIGSRGELAFLSLTTADDRQRERRTVERHVSQGCMLMSYVHEGLRRLDSAQRAPAPAIRLSAREREVLTWVGAGKTSWEIARILGLSERTAIFHVDNAMKKLATRTRSQAVARAVALGLITP
jgi:DNA-binding CsgD family transcriptional regulator